MYVKVATGKGKPEYVTSPVCVWTRVLFGRTDVRWPEPVKERLSEARVKQQEPMRSPVVGSTRVSTPLKLGVQPRWAQDEPWSKETRDS